jgi:RAV-like factor
MSSNICSEKNVSASTPASHDLRRQDRSAGDEAQEQTGNKAMKGGYSTEDRQDDEVGSAMTEEFNSSFIGVSENRRQPKLDAVRLKEWTSARSEEKSPGGMERMERGLSVVAGSGGESDRCEDLRRYSMSMELARRLPSSQYKGVIPQPNGSWGAQISEKHQRVRLGKFNRELDATKAYDGEVLKFRGRDAMTDLGPVGDGDQEARFIRERSTEEIIDMDRKHTYDEDFDHHCKAIKTTAARSAAMNNAQEPLWTEGPDLRDHVCRRMRRAVDGNENPSSSSSFSVSVMACLPGEHLFDKAVTPSDVGKLNRLVIPKQHAEKYFPLDINSSEKGLLLDFEDNTGKVWRFRYSYWNSSQSYVLTKGWSRFVKDKKLEAGVIVSFQRGSTESHQLYISWRRGQPGQARQGVAPHYHQSKGRMVYPVYGSSSLNPFNGTQATLLYNSQWMPILWPNSSNPDAFTQFNPHSVYPLVNKVDALWSTSPVTPLKGTLPFYLSPSPTKTTIQSRFYDINSDGLHPTELYLSLHNSLNSGDGTTNIKPLLPFVNPVPPSAAQESEIPEHNAASSIDLTTKKGVRLFGVILAEPQRLSA